MRPKTLKQAVMMAMAVLVVASGTLISQIVTHRYSTSLIQEASIRAEEIAHKLALDAADKILINDLVALQKLLDDQIATESNVAYLFVVREGKVLTHTFQAGVPVQLIDANRTEDPQKGRLEKIISQDGERYIDVAWPIFDGKAGELRLGLSEKPYLKKVSELWFQMSLISLLVLVFALLTGRFFADRLTRPLLELTATAETIGEDNLETYVQIKGSAEVNKLASSFNGMMTRLKDYTRRLQSNNQELEEKNEELARTQRQLATSLTVSQKVAALPKLNDVCDYVIQTVSSIADCRHMALLVSHHSGSNMFLASGSEIHTIGDELRFQVFENLHETNSVTFLDHHVLKKLPLPAAWQNKKRLAVFPIRYRNQPLGALLVACPDECRCVKQELDILELILTQTCGAIYRAAIHEEEIRNIRSRVEVNSGFSGIVGKDPQMQVVYKLIEDVAPTDATVLIEGESGTGKELVARAVHDKSGRSGKPFVVINCSAYPSTLLESELFGHEKGAFTGALRVKIGRFEQADGGTVFLDEIGEISASAQIKLLRVLQSQKFERLGGEQSIAVDVRILAATNKNLLQEVKNGRFREDLFYRLNVIPIKLPPVRERRNDIHLLAGYFLRRFAEQQGKHIDGFRSEAMRSLLDYRWPGNVRELENCIEHAVVLAKDRLIDAVDLPSAIAELPAVSTDSVKRHKSITKNEEILVKEVLEECDWNKTEAAARLGISRSTLYEKLKKYNISAPTLH